MTSRCARPLRMASCGSAVLILLVLVCPVPCSPANCTYVHRRHRVVAADCSGLGLTRVPSDLPSTLTSLDLSRNRLERLPACCFCSLTKLESLDLGGNRLAAVGNGSLAGLPRLRWLSLRNNRLAMEAPTFGTDVFRAVGGLRYLDLQQNAEQGYPDAALSALTRLTTLRLDGLPSGFGPGFGRLGRLEVLDLSGQRSGGCRLSKLPRDFFASLNISRPFTVNLTMCDLTSIHPDTFSYLPTLHTLDLSDNRYLNFTGFAQASRSLRYTGIKVLNISGIHREMPLWIKTEYFKHLGYTWLEQLVVESVKAYTIDLGAMFNLPTSLKYLSFHDNDIITADFLCGLYLLPNLDIVRISRQNHYTAQIHSPTSKLKADPLLESTTAINAFASSNHAEDYARSRWNTAEKSFTKGSFKTSTEYVHSQSLSESFNEVSGVLSPPKRELQSTSGVKTDASSGSMSSYSHKPSPAHFGAQPAADPSLCVDTVFLKTQDQWMYEYLDRLASICSANINYFNRSQAVRYERQNDSGVFHGVPRYKGEASDAERRWFTKKISSHFWSNDSFPLPPSVRVVYASDVKLGYNMPPLQFLANNIQYVDVSRNGLSCLIGPWLGLNRILHFDLSNNYAVFLGKQFFEGMPTLTHLYLQGNVLGESFANDSDGDILRNLKSLQVLNLNQNSIKQLSEKALLGQTYLTHLFLARNALMQFDVRVRHLTSLTFIDLSDNNIAFLGSACLEDLDVISKHTNLTVDLRRNTLSCACDSLGFWYWAFGDTAVRLHQLDEYRCTLGNGTELGMEELRGSLDTLWLRCQGVSLLAISAGLLATLLFLLTTFGVWRYKRWRLRYFYYVGLGRSRGHRQRHGGDPGGEVRDVFLCFDDEDPRVRLFVLNVLRPALVQRGLTYYVSEVDFAGRQIADIIVDAVIGSRKSVFVFSADFFPSYERELEFNMAVLREDEINRRVVLSLLYERIHWSTFPAEVKVYLNERGACPMFSHSNPSFVTDLMQAITAEVRI